MVSAGGSSNFVLINTGVHSDIQSAPGPVYHTPMLYKVHHQSCVQVKKNLTSLNCVHLCSDQIPDQMSGQELHLQQWGQFAYRPNRSTDKDTRTHILHTMLHTLLFIVHLIQSLQAGHKAQGPQYAYGSLTSWQTDTRWWGWVDTPHPPSSLTLEHPRAVF